MMKDFSDMSRHRFDKAVENVTGRCLCSCEIRTVQVNLGLRCNQKCAYCHVQASPERTEMMDWPIAKMVIAAVAQCGASQVDITGGAPELYPHLRAFIEALRGMGVDVQLRTNLTVLLEDGLEGMIRFLHGHEVKLVASLPCYLEENVTAQRGGGVYAKSIEAIGRLNAAGYGVGGGLQMNLVYNPSGPSLPPPQSDLEADYRRELKARFGVTFTRLLTITNMPLGRFGEQLRADGLRMQYMRMLEDSFNPKTIDALMCRHQISVGWDGTLYDCDFNLAMHYPVDHGAPHHIAAFDPGELAGRRIVVGEHCFGCTAGCGSSCGGALA